MSFGTPQITAELIAETHKISREIKEVISGTNIENRINFFMDEIGGSHFMILAENNRDNKRIKKKLKKLYKRKYNHNLLI